MIMNDFYKLPKIIHWLLALLLLVSGFFPALALIELGYAHPIAYLLVIFYVPIGQFSFTPFFTPVSYTHLTLPTKRIV